MQRLGNEFISLMSQWLHALWNFSMGEILRLVHNASGGVGLVKLLVILVVFLLVGFVFLRFVEEVTALIARVMSFIVYAVLAMFVIGACSWGINTLWRAVPDVIALH